MRKNQFYIILLIMFFASSCSLFHSVKTRTKTTNDNVIQKTPQGTIETATQSVTQTITETNPKKGVKPNTSSTPITEIAAPAFKPTTDVITKGTNTITITSSTSTEKKSTAYQQTIVTPETIENPDRFADCHVTTIQINAQSSTFMNADYSAQGQFIFPGAIYDYDDFKKGNYKPVDLPRNPIQLTSDNPNMIGSTWNVVENPDLSSTRDAIASLYSRFDNKQVGTMNLRYQTFESNTEAEFSLRLSGGASYSGFSLENEFKNTSNSTRQNITIDAIKPLYTISTSLPYTKQYFKTAVDTKLNPIVISSVTYGIRVLANFNLETKTKSEFDALRAKYSGITTTAHVDLDYLTKEAKTEKTINCYVVGGPGNSTVAFNKDDLEKGIKDLVGGVTYASARPISYTLSDLKGNIIETSSATDNITTRKCVPHEGEPELQDIIINIKTGDNDKDHDTHYRIYLRKGIDGSMNEYGDCSLDNQRDVRYPDNTSTTETMQNVNRTIKKDDFVKNNGGSILLYVNSGNDTWNISNLSIILLFKDGSHEKIDCGGFSISEQGRKLFLFNREFKNLQF